MIDGQSYLDITMPLACEVLNVFVTDILVDSTTKGDTGSLAWNMGASNRNKIRIVSDRTTMGTVAVLIIGKS